MFEAADEEEAEIINRHLGKWGDRKIYANRDNKPSDRKDSKRGFEPRGQKEERTERFSSREARQEARKEFFSNNGEAKKPRNEKSFGEGRKDFRDDRRPRRDGERPAHKFGGSKGGNRPFPRKKGEKK